MTRHTKRVQRRQKRRPKPRATLTRWKDFTFTLNGEPLPDGAVMLSLTSGAARAVATPIDLTRSYTSTGEATIERSAFEGLLRALKPPPFWTTEMLELAKSRDHADHLVVADWLEERLCRRAADVWRSPELGPWKTGIIAMAETAPEVAPRGVVLDLLGTQLSMLAKAQREALSAAEAARMYGAGLADFLSPELPPLPAGADDRPILATDTDPSLG